MKTIEQQLDEVLKREGGYVNDPRDSGGETNWGVTVAVARAYGYTGSMKDLPQETARAIYRQRYWSNPKFDQVAGLSAAIAEELLDTGINMGPQVAGRFLQRALNVLNRGGVLYPDLTADGQIGPMTVDALRQFLKNRGAVGEKVLFNMMNALQSVRYIELAEARAKDEEFVYGWHANRVSFI